MLTFVHFCVWLSHFCDAAGCCEEVLADGEHAVPVRVIWNCLSICLHCLEAHACSPAS